MAKRRYLTQRQYTTMNDIASTLMKNALRKQELADEFWNLEQRMQEARLELLGILNAIDKRP